MKTFAIVLYIVCAICGIAMTLRIFSYFPETADHGLDEGDCKHPSGFSLIRLLVWKAKVYFAPSVKWKGDKEVY